MDRDWLQKLGQGIDTPKGLMDSGLESGLDSETLGNLHENFRIRVPEAFAGRLRESTALRNQVIPKKDELYFEPQELEDPIGDQAHSPLPGLTHRYKDRVLLKLGHHCAVYCRFCFRRTTVSKTPMLKSSELDDALAYIRNHSEIWEVILTGGDPLVYPDKVLEPVLQDLGRIPHVRCVRFHTRIPTALPERITPKVLATLSALKRDNQTQTWIVSHINSADEFSPRSDRAFEELQQAGIPLLSQSVLLKGVNDSPGALEALFRGLVGRGIKPYYLHYPDLAQGTGHFRIPLEKALELVGELRSKLSGTCIPHFMLDLPGGQGKIPLEPENLRRVGRSRWQVRSPLHGHWVELNYPTPRN